MAEYRDLSAILTLAKDLVYRMPSTFYNGIQSLLQEIINLPAADVAQVVRCKDCRHRDPEDKKCDIGMPERQGCPFRVADDYFCAYGER